MKLLQQVVLTIALLTNSTCLFSQIFVNGIQYNITSSNTVEVTSSKRGYPYEGHMAIPQSIYYEGKTYKVTAIGDAVFNYGKITGITLPEGLERIGEFSFANTSIKSIVIPNSVTSLGKSAFESSDITSLTIGTGLTTISEHAFAGCQLKEIIIPDNITIIEDYAFLACWFAEKIVIGNNVTHIGEYAFCKCTEVTEVRIPNSVKEIGYGAICAIPKLKKLEIDCDTIKDWFSDGFELYFTDLIIGDNVEVISPYAFMNCQLIERLTISRNVRKIGEGAFNSCQYMTDIYSHIPAEFLFEIDKSVFEYVDKEKCNLHVPYNSKTKYRSTKHWNEFLNILNPGETAVKDIKSEACKNNIHNLKGERVDKPSKGVYIIDGKKRLIK